MNAIEFNNVSKKFKKGEKFNSLRDTIPALFNTALRSKLKKQQEDREFWAVEDVTFNIKRGEVVGIMGPNGAGKSTILKMLSGIMAPNKGTMKIDGRLSALIEVTAGFHSELTGRENVYLNGTILGMSKKEIANKFDEIVEFSGIGEFIDTPVKHYSSGMFSRLGFSVASHMDPDILLVDEVLSVGDIAFQAQCSEKMRELLKSGKTIVLVSHSLALIQSLCKRAILLQQGKMIKDGPAAEVIPFYQNIVLEKAEADFRKRMQASPHKVRLDVKALVAINNVVLQDDQGHERHDFLSHAPINLMVEYKSDERIEKPIFDIEIIRSDGVSCCAANSSEQKGFMDFIDGKGLIKIDLGRLHLSPGVYMAKLSVWDEDMIHPFAMRDQDIIRIVSDQKAIHASPVFFPEIKWAHIEGKME